MYKFNIGDKDYNFPETWQEITLGMFIKIVELEKNKEFFPIEELYFIKMVEILTESSDDELDEMSIPQLNELAGKMTYLQTEPKMGNMKQHINFEGVDYAFKQDLNQLTTGEYISMKTLQQDREYFEYLPEVLAILLRPAKKEMIEETLSHVRVGKEVWVQEKFNPMTLSSRAETLKRLPYLDVIGGINFFFNGSNQSKTTMKDSSEEVIK